MMTARERGRRKLVALIMLVYVLLIFEGSIRKWMFPTLAQVLFFIRDPFVLIAYFLAFRHGFFPKRNVMMMTGLAFGVLSVLLVAAQTLSPTGSSGGAPSKRDPQPLSKSHLPTTRRHAMAKSAISLGRVTKRISPRHVTPKHRT